MVCVFLAFVLSEQRPVKEFGFGLAVAVLVDATLVRLILVPSVVQALGDRSWWFPRWLDHLLPHLDVEGEAAPAAAPTAADGDGGRRRRASVVLFPDSVVASGSPSTAARSVP